MSLRFHVFGSVVLAALVFGGCDSCSKKPDVAPTSIDAATASDASAPALVDAGVITGEAVDGGLHHAMSNCPTSVAGADVAIKDVAGGVEVAVTSKDSAATNAIRDRAKKLAEADAHAVDGGPGAVQHNHSGAGGGTTGRCTIILRNTVITTADAPGGTTFTVKAKDPKELDWLRRETRERNIEAKSASAVGAGAQRMAHCASAVDGAKTMVRNEKDGVVVTITGPADKVDEIRTRAKHTEDVAKKSDAGAVQHSGEGTGGGAVGRCPIVVEGDTTVTEKDVPGGIEVTVTTKKDVAALQKETMDRASNFDPK